MIVHFLQYNKFQVRALSFAAGYSGRLCRLLFQSATPPTKFEREATHQFRTKIHIPRAIHKSEQAVTIVVAIAVGSLNNMIVEAK